MPAPKGRLKPPGSGRVKGTPNKVTQKARETIGLLVENYIDQLQEWLDVVSAKDPAKALELYLRTLEFCLPKLARKEHLVKEEENLTVVVKNFVISDVGS